MSKNFFSSKPCPASFLLIDSGESFLWNTVQCEADHLLHLILSSIISQAQAYVCQIISNIKEFLDETNYGVSSMYINYISNNGYSMTRNTDGCSSDVQNVTVLPLVTCTLMHQWTSYRGRWKLLALLMNIHVCTWGLLCRGKTVFDIYPSYNM